MFEFLDSIDVEQPFFYLRPCTRCLKCGSHLMPDERRKLRNFWPCNYWKCKGDANVGLGARNQVTGKIVWSERHEQAGLRGTSLEFAGVKPQPIVCGINDGHQGFMDEDENGYQPPSDTFIEWYEPPISTDNGGFSSLLAAILFFRKHHNPNEIRVAKTPSCWSGELLSSAHDLMEALLNDPLSREFQTSNANFNRA